MTDGNGCGDGTGPGSPEIQCRWVLWTTMNITAARFIKHGKQIGSVLERV